MEYSAFESLYNNTWKAVNDPLTTTVLDHDKTRREVSHLDLASLTGSRRLPSTVVVLSEYINFRKAVEARLEEPDCYELLAVLLGHTGIGKTLFLYYLLVYRLYRGLPTAFEQDADCFYLFDHEGFHAGKQTDTCHLSQDVWALSDSNEDLGQPSRLFRMSARVLIQATAPLASNYKEWAKQRDGHCYIMPPPVWADVEAIGLLHGWDMRRLRDVYNKWGPDLRTCRRLTTHPGGERNYEAYVNQCIQAVLFSDMARLLLGPAEQIPDCIFVCDGGSEAPDLERYAILRFAVRGERVRQLMAAAAALFSREQQVALFISLAAVEVTRAVAKIVLAEWMYALFNDKSFGRRRPICTLLGGSVFMLPQAENVRSLEDWLHYPDPSDFPVFLRPKAMNSSVDGVFMDSHRIVVFRVTASGSEKIDLESEAAQRLKDALPSEWTQSWVFVYAAPTRPMGVAYLQRAPVIPTAFGKNVQFGSFVCKSSRHEDEEL